MKKASTRDVIAGSTLELLQNKRIEEITVAEIIHETGISNRTFYNHFQDKFDVCNYIYDQLLDQKCWITDGRRSTLSEFSAKLTELMKGDYAKFFSNTAFYLGQENLQDHIVSHGVEDLKKQLIYTGNEELISAESIGQLEVYMRGLAATMQYYARKRFQGESLSLRIDMTKNLPQELHEALTACPIIHD